MSRRREQAGLYREIAGKLPLTGAERVLDVGTSLTSCHPSKRFRPGADPAVVMPAALVTDPAPVDGNAGDAGYILCLEGGGSRCQAAMLDYTGACLQLGVSTDVNTNFVSHEAAQHAVLDAVTRVLQASGIRGEQVDWFVSALVGPRFGRDLFGALLPQARYRYYTERDVVFARARVYRPHGVAVVAATGCSAWGVRADDGRAAMVGGWGTLLGDEGSAYAAGVAALRAAARVYDGRERRPTRLVHALIDHFDLTWKTFRPGMVDIAYHNPISRPEIAALAKLVTRLADEGDRVALDIVQKVARDMTGLALHVANQLFAPEEAFTVVAAGGLLNAGELILGPLRHSLAGAFPNAALLVGTEEPAIALGRLALYHSFEPLDGRNAEC